MRNLQFIWTLFSALSRDPAGHQPCGFSLQNAFKFNTPVDFPFSRLMSNIHVTYLVLISSLAPWTAPPTLPPWASLGCRLEMRLTSPVSLMMKAAISQCCRPMGQWEENSTEHRHPESASSLSPPAWVFLSCPVWMFEFKFSFYVSLYFLSETHNFFFLVFMDDISDHCEITLWRIFSLKHDFWTLSF